MNLSRYLIFSSDTLKRGALNWTKHVSRDRQPIMTPVIMGEEPRNVLAMDFSKSPVGFWASV
jgi:hypothetical protein